MASHFAGVVNGIACYVVVDQRLVFDRECSNRSGDALFVSSTMSGTKYADLPDIVSHPFLSFFLSLIIHIGHCS